MHKRLVIFAIILIVLVFFITQISQQRHSLTGKIVEQQEDLFTEPQSAQPEKKELSLENTEPEKKRAIDYIIQWLGL